MKRAILVMMLLYIVLVASTTLAQDGAFTESECAIPVPPDKTLICGTVEVPEQFSDPDGNTIVLSVVIVKGGDAADPLVVFNGGPGSNSLVLANVFMESPIIEDRDIVVYSDRGTPNATPDLECPEVDTAADDIFGAPMSDVFSARLEGYEACRMRLLEAGVNLNAYNSVERTAEVPFVMSALGYDTFNIWGVSGGGFLAQAVNREYPDRVNTLMLDSAAQSEAFMGHVFVNILQSINSSFEAVFDTCAMDAICNDAFPQLEVNFWDTIADLNSNPMPVTIVHPQTGEAADVLLTGDSVLLVLSNEFSNVANLPRIMNDLMDVKVDYIVDRLPNNYMGDPGYSDGLYQSVFCAEMGQFTLNDVNTEGVYPPIIDAFEEFLQFNIDICDIWDVSTVQRGELITSDTPILIMEGVFDSNKQLELGQVVIENYDVGYLVEFGDKAHVTLGACALNMMAEFMNAPTVAPDMSCVAERPQFVVGGNVLTFSEVTFESLGIAAQIPDDWQELQPGVYQDSVNGTLLVILALPAETESNGIEAFISTLGLPEFERIGEEIMVVVKR